MRTPHQFVEDFDLPADCGKARRIPRSLQHIQTKNKRDKARALGAFYTLIGSGNLAQPGEHEIFQHHKSQDELAAMCGYKSRSSFTRATSLLVELGLIARRRNWSTPNAYDYHPKLPRAVCFYGCSDRKTCRHESKPGVFYAPTLEMLRSSELRDLWPTPAPPKDGALLNENRGKPQKQYLGVADYKERGRWLWNERLPFRVRMRMVADCYIANGIEDPADEEQRRYKKQGRWYRQRGVLNISQRKVAEQCGVSIRTVYNANCILSGQRGCRCRGKNKDCKSCGGTGSISVRLWGVYATSRRVLSDGDGAGHPGSTGLPGAAGHPDHGGPDHDAREHAGGDMARESDILTGDRAARYQHRVPARTSGRANAGDRRDTGIPGRAGSQPRYVGWWTTAVMAIRAKQRLERKTGLVHAVKLMPPIRLIRVAHPKPIKGKDGRLVRGPQRILWLPALKLSRDEAIIETERMLAARKAIHDAHWAEVGAKLHAELLRASIGQETTLHAFWRALRRRYEEAGMAQQHIRALLPLPPD